MSTPCTFRVVGVNRSPFERSNGIFDKTRLVERVGMDCDLHIVLIGNRQAAVDCSRCCSPVLVELKS